MATNEEYQELNKALSGECERLHNENKELKKELKKALEQMPEVTSTMQTGQFDYVPSKPKGHWIQIENFDTWTHNYACSECDGRVLCCRLDMPRFCGFCGAEMEIDKSKGQLYAD